MNRYRFNEKTIVAAKKFLKGEAKREPAFLKKFKGTVKEGKLYLDDKMVVPKEKVDTFLRNKIYEGKTPLSRDAAFYWISKNTVGVSRKAVDDWLKKQRVIRETDNQQATTKRPKRQVKTKGQLHIDLVEIKWKDLPFEPKAMKDIGWEKMSEEEKAEGEDEINKGYFFGCVDALTSLAYFKFAKFKTYKYITPIAHAAFKWMSKQLGVPLKKMTVKSDMGSEFNWKKYQQWGLKTITVRRDAFIEAKNSHFQRVLYRLAKMNTTRDLHALTSKAMTQMNRTVSSVSKKAPVENLKENVTDISKKYNAKRGKDSGVKIKKKALVPGKDKVRVQLKWAKDKKMYKAYKGKMWSKRNYVVKAKKGSRYTVNGKTYHRDELKLTEDYDPKSERLLKKRADQM
jgi:hypothetical protein